MSKVAKIMDVHGNLYWVQMDHVVSWRASSDPGHTLIFLNGQQYALDVPVPIKEVTDKLLNMEDTYVEL